MNTKKSLLKRVLLFMITLMLLLVFVLVFYSASSYFILVNQVEQGAENFLSLYGGELKSRVAQMDTVLKNVLVQNSSQLQLLKSPEESKRYYAAQDIINYMGDVLLNDKSVECLIVADNHYDICLDAQVVEISYWDKEALRDFTKECTLRDDIAAKWGFAELNGKNYLYKMFVYNGRAAAAYTSTEHFMETIPVGDYTGQTYVLTGSDGSVQEVSGEEVGEQLLGAKIDEIHIKNTFLADYVVQSGQIMLYSIVRNTSMWSQTRLSMSAVLGVILLTIVFGILLVRYIQKEIISPMKKMAHGMKRVDEGEYTLHFEGEYSTAEFTHLKDSFNKLMDEIVGLKIKSYEKIIELKDSQLKIIRLQIRPHFFLNAITTIHSLGSKGKEKQVNEYIDALSKNIRYMFKSSLHTVTVKEEIRHVENYFKMQELKYAGSTFHFIDLPKELEGWLIPQMIIQTFIENEFKHAVSTEYVLTILIRISKKIYKDEEMLVIEIEDDGKGYPQDVIDYMNGSIEYDEDTGSRIGLWSVRNMLELMYERGDLLEIYNTEPHGGKSRIYIPAKPLHEIKENTPSKA
ncbi:MAG: histidine kinase [Clostridia bacterium]|nr:histidine kinase [Clostridia bacterium]